MLIKHGVKVDTVDEVFVCTTLASIDLEHAFIL